MTEKHATKAEVFVSRLIHLGLVWSAFGILYGVGRLTVSAINYAVAAIPKAVLIGLACVGLVAVFLVAIAIFVWVLCELIIRILRACMRIGTLIRGMRSSRRRNSSSS